MRIIAIGNNHPCYYVHASYNIYGYSLLLSPGLKQRLMGIVVQEVGTRSTPASEMVLKSFLAWEREIRKELTEPAWQVCEAPVAESQSCS